MTHIKRINEFYSKDNYKSLMNDFHEQLNIILSRFAWKMPKNSKLYYDEQKKYDYNFFTCDAQKVTKGKGKGECVTDAGMYRDSNKSSLIAYYPEMKTVYVVLYINSVCGKDIKDKENIKRMSRNKDTFAKFVKTYIGGIKSEVFNGKDWDIDELVTDTDNGVDIKIPLVIKDVKDYHYDFPGNKFAKEATEVVDGFVENMKNFIKKWFAVID